MDEKLGGFVFRIEHSNTTKGQSSSQNESEIKSQKTETLILYREVESICTSIKKGKNYVEHILPDDKLKTSNLANRGPLKDIQENLPSYFLQINQSEIVNVFHIKDRSSNYLFTKLNSYKISRNLKKEVNTTLEKFFHTSRKITK